jgi:nucleotide-diphospho-sugar transferase
MFDGRGRWAIVLFATRGLAAFVENAIFGIVRCGIEPGIVQLVFPADAESELSHVAQTLGVRPRILQTLVEVEPSDMPAAYVEWNTPEFNLLLKYRFPVLRAILAEGYRVISADVDIAWFRNPLSYLSSVLDRHSWACQTESSPEFPPNFCLGFFALSHTHQTLGLIDRHIAKYVGLTESDQLLFRRLLLEDSEQMSGIFPLPEGLFPGGLLYGGVGIREEPPVPMPHRLAPFIFHANWCVGLENKRNLLAHVGGWYV